jgi:DNA-binding Lrp family transcriptional regulator
MESLDKRDRLILLLLDTDATTPLSEIAKRLKISKEAVLYRIRQLEARDIILQYVTLSHFAKTGRIHFKVYLQFNTIPSESKQEIIDYLSSAQEIGWLASTEGVFDLMFSIRFPTIFEFEDFKDVFCQKFDKFIQNMQIAILTEAETKPRYYLLPEYPEKKVSFLHCDKSAAESLDEEDWKILHAIATNARTSSVELEKKTGITQRIIRYRRADLEKKGIIVGYKLAINYRKLGFLFFKCFITFRNLTNNQYLTLREYIRTSPNIIYWIKTIGSWDAELEIESASAEDYYALIGEIKSRFAPIILRIDSTLVSKEHIITHV